ncbi:hypothetical protein CZ787_15890 [Halomonas citrativorans]|uniref:Uncharacterized protein n=1 Tax=Halomonas citrativorans TaxID=2742612 RepID=A0A1R4I3Z6_9GAMM|nr:hypothetical protein CZ787_15890 [Halomonas citrativorans]
MEVIRFQCAEKLSMAALSRQFPFLDMLRSILFSTTMRR